MALIDDAKPLIARKVAQLGYDVVDIKYFRAGPRSILRIFIDKAGGVTIADCETVSNDVGVMLEVEGFSNRPYTLEVSSPGIDRPLADMEDYARNVGRTVRIELKEALEKKKKVVGRVLSADTMAVTIEATEKKQGAIRVVYSNIVRGKIEPQFK